MKVSDTPRTGKIAQSVFYMSPYGVCCRQLVIPHDPRSEAQTRMRSILGAASSEWTHRFTEAQRRLWTTTALSVPSSPSLSQYSHLDGHQLCIKINSTLRLIGQAPRVLPPELVVFTPNPVTGLEIVNDAEAGVRLLLNVGTLTEDVMVYGQPPCNAGRMKRRRAYYLGLAGPATNGQCDITALYTARFGTPEPGKKVFIVTCQTRNGWQAPESVFSAIVEPPPSAARSSTSAATLKANEAQDNSNAVESSAIAAPRDGRTPAAQQIQPATPPAAAETPMGSPASPKPISPRPPAVYKRSTRGARDEHTSLDRGHVLSSSCAGLVHGLRMALNRLGILRMARAGG
jgi:hypothetical protein